MGTLQTGHGRKLESERALNYAAETAGKAADYLLEQCFPTAQVDIRTVAQYLQYAIDLVSLRLAVPNFQSPTVTFFGSARNDVAPETRQAVKHLASCLAKNGLTVATGGGPGIMSDANEGAFLVNPNLSSAVPHAGLEGEKPNPYASRRLSVSMYDFPQRVEGLSDDLLTQGFIINKGGFGTLEERCQVAAYMKEDTILKKQVVLYDQGGYWSKINPLLESMIVDRDHRRNFHQLGLTTSDEKLIVAQMRKINLTKPSKMETFSYQDRKERSIEDLAKPFDRIVYGSAEYIGRVPIADFISGAIKSKLEANPNIKNFRIPHANLLTKLFLDSLATVAYLDIFSRDTQAFKSNVTIFGHQESEQFEQAQELALASGLNVFNRLPKGARKLSPGYNKGMIKRWEGLGATIQDQEDDSFGSYNLSLRRRTASGATALRMSSKALFLAGNEATLKLAMKALCWTQTEQMHPGKPEKVFTPIFVGEPWATIDRRGNVDGPMKEMLSIMLENNCIRSAHVQIPKFARNTEEALAGHLFTIKS